MRMARFSEPVRECSAASILTTIEPDVTLFTRLASTPLDLPKAGFPVLDLSISSALSSSDRFFPSSSSPASISYITSAKPSLIPDGLSSRSSVWYDPEAGVTSSTFREEVNSDPT